MRIEYTVPKGQQNVKLGLFLRRQGVSAGYIKQVKYSSQGLLCNGVRVRTNHILQPQDVVSVLVAPAEECCVMPQPVPVEILYESPHVLGVNKPAGLVVHPTLSHHEGTLANGFAYLMQQRGWQRAFRPVGRLDANTSGVMLCAMHALAAPIIQTSMRKGYIALVQGRVAGPQGEINEPLGPLPGSAVVQQVSQSGKPSCTRYRVLAANQHASVVWVTPLTGRTHQIRVHFAHIGHPLLGDTMYGGSDCYMQRHALHCAAVAFEEPGKIEKTLRAPLPQDMLEAACKVDFLEKELLAICEQLELRP